MNRRAAKERTQSSLAVSVFHLLPSSFVRGPGSYLSRHWASLPLSGVSLRKATLYMPGFFFPASTGSHLFTGPSSNAEIIDDVTNLLVLMLIESFLERCLPKCLCYQ